MFDNMLDDIPVKLMDIDNIIEEWHRQDEIENIPYQDYSSKKSHTASTLTLEMLMNRCLKINGFCLLYIATMLYI